MFHEQEVRAGMAFLDERKPQWRASFNPSLLDVGSVDDCVLCQCFPGDDYNMIVSYELHLSEEQADALGFYLMPDDLFTSYFERQRQFAALTETWKHLFDEKPATVLPAQERQR